MYIFNYSADPSRLQYNSPEFVQNSEKFSTQLLQHGEPGDQPLRQVQQEVYTAFYQVRETCCKIGIPVSGNYIGRQVLKRYDLTKTHCLLYAYKAVIPNPTWQLTLTKLIQFPFE